VLAFVMLVLTWALRLSIETLLDLTLDHRFWLRDYLGNLAIATVCLVLVQRLAPGVLLATIIVSILQIGNATKLAVLGTPASPDDVIQISNLFYLTDGWRRVAMYVLVALPILLAVWLIKWRRPSMWIALAAMVAGVAFAATNSKPLRAELDKRFGNSVWNQPQNFKRRGLALHMAQESIRTLAKVEKTPSRQAVDNALEQLPLKPFDSTSVEQRNVHMIVLESFADVATLGPDWVPEDPYSPEFRQLWAEAGNSKALAPVFGGYTANAEFEALCGYPVTANAVFFEGWLRRSVPCLPDLMRQAGFRTVASHPNVAGFWNRTHAYRLVGFDEYLSKSSYDTTDSVGSFLLDHSYYEQTFELLGSLDAQPIFNYMLTYHGHLPYPTNENYPDQVQAGNDAKLLHGYLNHIWYKSRDLMAMLDRLRQDDPDSLIVIFGDHLPFLGSNYGVYREVLGLPENRDDFTGQMLEHLVTTPLIVIDGKRGPLTVGKVPLYQLPSLILSLLGSEGGGMLDWAENPQGEIIRPVYGIHIVDKTHGEVPMQRCEPDAALEACDYSLSWLSSMRTLIADIFTGDQYSLQRLSSTN